MTTLKDLRRKLSQPRAKRTKLTLPIRFVENGKADIGDFESDEFYYISLHSSEPGEKLENEVRFSGYVRQGVKLKKTDVLDRTMSAEAAFPIFESEEGIIMYAALSDKFGKLICVVASEKKMAPSMGRATRTKIRVQFEDRCLR